MKITKTQLDQIIKEEIEIFNEETTMKNIVLDIAGLVPGLGEPADFINGVDYAMKGDYLFSALSFISVIPELGDAIGKGGKIAIGLSKLGKRGRAAAKTGQKLAGAKKLQQASGMIRKIKALLKGKKTMINSLFDKLGQSENEHVQKHLPKVKGALDVFISQEEPNTSRQVGAPAVAAQAPSSMEESVKSYEVTQIISESQKTRWQVIAGI